MSELFRVFAALGGARLLRSTVFGLTVADPALLIAAALFLIIVGIAAACGPAWRALRMDPLGSPRHEQ